MHWNSLFLSDYFTSTERFLILFWFGDNIWLWSELILDADQKSFLVGLRDAKVQETGTTACKESVLPTVLLLFWPPGFSYFSFSFTFSLSFPVLCYKFSWVFHWILLAPILYSLLKKCHGQWQSRAFLVYHNDWHVISVHCLANIAMDMFTKVAKSSDSPI